MARVPLDASPVGSSVVWTVNGRRHRSTDVAVSHRVSAPNLWACFRIRSMSSGPWIPFGEAGEVVDLGGQRELAAGFESLEDEGREIGAGRVERGGKPAIPTR